MDVRNQLYPAAGLQRQATANPVQATEPANQPKAAATEKQAALGADSAHVSPAARLAGQAMQLPEVRADKVAAVQKAISDGSYAVPPHAVADAMLRSTSA